MRPRLLENVGNRALEAELTRHFLEIVDRAGKANAPIDQERDVVGQLLELAHDVRRQHERPISPALLGDLVFHHAAGDRIEPAVGSSRKSADGENRNASAALTFCRVPPDNTRSGLSSCDREAERVDELLVS